MNECIHRSPPLIPKPTINFTRLAMLKFFGSFITALLASQAANCGGHPPPPPPGAVNDQPLWVLEEILLYPEQWPVSETILP